jgi:hypothetical protein
MMRILITGMLVSCVLSVSADEGMWLFNQPPRQMFKERYQFEPTDDWLEHLQKASVRFNSGGSGSFVSADGLLISNHHVGADDLQKISTPAKDFVKDGFYARNLSEERKCLDLELNVLQTIEDVTARVNAAVPGQVDAEKAFEARRKVIAEIEKESLEKTGLRSDVVTLWKGGAYHLYRYKRYTDVRLVFAPEKQAAFFGGDPDNFEFPRFDLDICLFRAYENGKPAHITHYLKFSTAAPREGELVFVSGHPGGTSRLQTVAELVNTRDNTLPFYLELIERAEVLLGAWSARSIENARRAQELYFGVQNARKALKGEMAGLLDPSLIASKTKAEEDFKSRLQGKAELTDALAAYDKIAESTKVDAGQMVRAAVLALNKSESFYIARRLLRAGDERPKPNGERLEEFSDANKESLELSLFSEKPIYADFETLLLSDVLTLMANKLGADDLLVQKVLAGKSPEDRAVELVQSTKVRDVAFRKQLYQGGTAAVAAADDPMIELARLLDPEARSLRKVAEAQSEKRKQAQFALSKARLALLGTSGYPDATFSLRLSFGVIKGYEEKGSHVPAFTTFAGLYERAGQMNNRPPFDLPPIWQKRRGRLNAETPLNFVSTCDIIGGNSGSPVVNRAGEFVGIIFDGNLASLPWDYAYDDRQGRAISVSSAGILEALDKVYGARAVVKELLGAQQLSSVQ